MNLQDLENFKKIYDYAIEVDKTFKVKDTEFYIWNCLKGSLKAYGMELYTTKEQIVNLIDTIKEIWLESDKPISKICDYAVVKMNKIDNLSMSDILEDLEYGSEDWEDDDEDWTDFDEEEEED